MARKKQPRRIFPIKHDFYASLDRFIHEATMLADAVRQALDHDLVKEPASIILKARADAFDVARD